MEHDASQYSLDAPHSAPKRVEGILVDSDGDEILTGGKPRGMESPFSGVQFGSMRFKQLKPWQALAGAMVFLPIVLLVLVLVGVGLTLKSMSGGRRTTRVRIRR